MKILHLACLNNDPEIQPNMGPKCNPFGGEPHIYLDNVKMFEFEISNATDRSFSGRRFLYIYLT